MKFAKVVFYIAGIEGLILVTPMYFLESAIAQQDPPAITHPEFFYGFIGVAVAWQILFLIIARDPVRFRLAMLAGIVEKLTFGGAVLLLFFAGRVSTQTMALAAVDLLFAPLFAISFLKTRVPPNG